MTDITVIDAVCGAGKTQGAIQYMNAHQEEYNFIYVTPFNKEVERIIEACPDLHFQTGKVNRKVEFLHMALKAGTNICCTHEAFLYLDENDVDNILLHDYIVICDEVMDVIRLDSMSKDDVHLLQEKYVDTSADGTIRWREDQSSYAGYFSDAKALIDHRCMKVIDGTLMRIFPANVLRAAQQVYILTYMFPFSIMRAYCNLMNLSYRVCTLGEPSTDWAWNLQPFTGEYRQPQLAQLIHIYEGKWNKIGETGGEISRRDALTKSWYGLSGGWSSYYVEKHRKAARRALHNVIRNQWNVRGESVYWCAPKGVAAIVADNGYKKRFLPCNARATNEYRSCTHVVYAYNLFPNAYLGSFLANAHVPLDKNHWALAELIQFIMRSAVRDGKPIDLYLPSERMRRIFVDFLEHGVSIKKC